MAVVKILGGYLEIEGGGLGIWGGPPLYPDQGLPPGSASSPSHPAHPIYNPPSPPYPAHPMPPYPDQGLPGGTPVPPSVWPTPPQPLPPELASQVIVAVHRPGHDWEVAAFPVAPAHPIPPAPQPVG
jgi:hypothetical protein